MATRTTTLRLWHRRLGFIFCLGALCSSGSGVIHTLMTRSQEPPPPARPAGSLKLDAVKIDLHSATQDLDALRSSIQAVNIRTIGGEPWYQFFVNGKSEPIYVNAVRGEQDPNCDERYAAQIASDFLGGQTVVKTNYLTAYDNEYLNIFRLLPVYRFDADDGKATRVYVSTVTGSVARHTDRWRQLQANLFGTFHKLNFIPDKTLRDWTLIILTLGVFMVALTGLILYFVTYTRRRKQQVP